MGEHTAANNDALYAGSDMDEKLFKHHDQELLPGLPNEVTLDYICTKVPWTTFPVLASLNHTWERLFESQWFYNARVRFSGEVLAVHSHGKFDGTNKEKVAIYSPKNECCNEVPPIPQVKRGVPMDCQCVTVNGKVYILGGEDDVIGGGKKEMYVFDLFSRRMSWKPCASMKNGRCKFACIVLDEHIYALGGVDTPEGVDPLEGEPFSGSEVYDPKTDTWSPIMSMESQRVKHQVASMGGELVVYGGYNIITGQELPFMEIYSPIRDHWRRVDPLFDIFHSPMEGVFTLEGQFCLLHEVGVYILDQTSWKQLHSNLFPDIGSYDSFVIEPYSTVIVNNDELIVGVHWNNIHDQEQVGSFLVRGKGFRGRSNQIIWQVVPYCNFGFFTSPLLL